MLNSSHLKVIFTIVLSLMWTSSLSAQSRATLFSESELSPRRMTRSWFTQVDLNRFRSRLVGITQHEGTLFAQTDDALVQAIDSETGRTLWTAEVGHPNHPSSVPAANEKFVAVVNGSHVYVLDRATGRPRWDRQLRGGPGGGPALTKRRVYIPMINGRVESYDLEHLFERPDDSSELEPRKKKSWNYASVGRALTQPLVTADSVAWPTDAGFLYVGASEEPAIRFRVETDFSITSMPAYRKPLIFVASLDGYVYAFDEIRGKHAWRFSTGDPINESPVVIQDRIYVCPDRGGMYCVSAESGKQIWWTPGVAKFLAASPGRVYGTDKVDELFVIDAKTGARLETISFHGLSHFLSNSETDRIYLASNTGLIQCLHDISQTDPVSYKVESDSTAPESEDKEPNEALDDSTADEPSNAEPLDEDTTDEDPFGGGEDSDSGEDPFGGGSADDDPFG